MVTVIGLKELDKLISTGHLRGSDNIEFLKKRDSDPIKARELQDLIREQIQWLTGQQATGGFITVLKGVSNDITESIIRTRSHEVVMLLPEPVDPVFLVLPDNLPCIAIDVNSLMIHTRLRNHYTCPFYQQFLLQSAGRRIPASVSKGTGLLLPP